MKAVCVFNTDFHVGLYRSQTGHTQFWASITKTIKGRCFQAACDWGGPVQPWPYFNPNPAFDGASRAYAKWLIFGFGYRIGFKAEK